MVVLNLRNSQLPPTPEELADVPSESTVIVKASSDSDYSLFDYVKAFRPHIKVASSATSSTLALPQWIGPVKRGEEMTQT